MKRALLTFRGKEWNGDKFDAWNKIIQLYKLGYPSNYLIQVEIYPSFWNTSRNSIYFKSANLGLSREYLVKGRNDSAVKAYYQYVL